MTKVCTRYGRSDEIGRIAPDTIPRFLRRLGLKSVMIEGGSRVLSSFLRSPPREDGSPMVDTVIVTVAPMFIGDGVGVVPNVSEQSCPF
jgi:2,5-diamino-6-(ribosylamino)-4(3H)-pyrimidinone 5'-phosphate reductase